MIPKTASSGRELGQNRGIGDNSVIEKLTPGQRAALVFEQANRFFDPVHAAFADHFMQARMTSSPAKEPPDFNGFNNSVLEPIRQKCMELAEAHVAEYGALIQRYAREEAAFTEESEAPGA